MLEVRDLRKHYGSTHALDGLDLVANPGEILGVAGPNGAGKTTLIKILAGEETLDGGQILIDGEAWTRRTAGQGVAVVHQEPQLFPNLSVADNLLVGREASRFSRPKAGQKESTALTELQISRLSHTQLGRLALSIQQRTEIARAVSRDARLFLFDEPNSALTDEESDQLFARMHTLADSGRIVILVSHRLTDLSAHAKRVAVIRDGRLTALLQGAQLTQEAIARELVVEDQAGAGGRRAPASGDPAREEALLSIGSWIHPRGVFTVEEFHVARDEIVAVMGVEGSGAREFVASVAGNEAGYGDIQVAGLSGRRALRALTVYVAPSRAQTLFHNFSVGNNVVARLGTGDIAGRSRNLRRRRMVEIAERARAHFFVRCSSIHQSIRALSGGNQQKVVIAAAMARRPSLLVADEPTRGVDIGSKAEIYALLREFAGNGNGVLLHCTEVPEVFEVADRVLVVDQGHLSPRSPSATTRVSASSLRTSLLSSATTGRTAPPRRDRLHDPDAITGKEDQ